jgi:glycosyltransferase involved in cell wall biosynthesis
MAALANLKDLPNWRLWIAGGVQRQSESAYLDHLKRLATELNITDRIFFLGERTDVPRLLSAADIYSQPNSGPEPFGIAFVEALYAGLPVVTTRQGAALEIINDSCGVLVDAGDPSDLSLALRNLINEPGYRNKLSAAAPLRAKQLCDPQARLRELEDLLCEQIVSES